MESRYLQQRRLQKLGTAKPVEKEKLKGIANFSKKRVKKNREYKKIVQKKIEENPVCEIKSPVCTYWAEGLNHKQKRSPKNLIEEKNLENSCNACNGYCETHPVWAKEHGHFISKFQK